MRVVGRIAARLHEDWGALMPRKTQGRDAGITREEARLSAFVDDIAPRLPTVKVYRLEPGGKQKFLFATVIEFFSLEILREEYDGGKFLVRTVHSNGTYGPSRVVDVASRRERYNYEGR